MSIFGFHEQAVGRYREFIRSFVSIDADDIGEFVLRRVLSDQGEIWPEPLIQLSPSYMPGKTVDELASEGALHPITAGIFRDGSGRPFRLYRHQEEALKRAAAGENYVLTSGTGSGKSFAYFLPIVDAVVRDPKAPGPRALIVYPMNALVNSQLNALEELKERYERVTGKTFPVRFSRYTGQTSEDERRKIRENPPHIILTNYVMGEFLLVRPEDERALFKPQGEGTTAPLFLVFDELHTYRGRQGSDVAMLVRRMRSRLEGRPVVHIGTSATMVADEKATAADRRQIVAEFASRFFGEVVEPNNVIEETLRPVTEGGPPGDKELRVGLTQALPKSLGTFVRHPLVRFVEYAMGIEEEEPGHYRRRRPRKVSEAAKELAEQLTIPARDAEDRLREVLVRSVEFESGGRPLFAFKMHQFISQTPPLYATLGPKGERRFETEFSADPDNPLYPLYFCRSCGQEYYGVKIKEGKFVPYAPFLHTNPEEDEPKSAVGYLALAKGFNPGEDLPDTWVDDQGGPLRKYRERVPQAYYVAPSGRFVAAESLSPSGSAPEGSHAFYFQKKPFGLCLNCGADWVTMHPRASEFRKLTYLGSEGRTSSTSTLGFELLEAARKSEGQVREKLLTFTDNRQDAALQAGHFNDFIQVLLVRAALYHALAAKGELGSIELGKEALRYSGLTLKNYAASPLLSEGPRVDAVRDLFTDLIRYRLIIDLERDWRFVHPSLEEVGLLEVGYKGADDPAFLHDLSGVLRRGGIEAAENQAKEIALALLDYLRKSLAVMSTFLDREYWKDLARKTQSDLSEFWRIDPDTETPPRISALTLGKTRTRPRFRPLRLSTRSRLGRYLLQLGASKDGFDDFAKELVAAFARYGLLQETDPGSGLYQIPELALVWRRGSGEPRRDPLQHKGNRPPRANPYFQSLYKTQPKDLAYLEAREHTAQVPPNLREERERRFRGEEKDLRLLPYLISSPTLELGVDIADLDMVHLRNIPPTPANYAQRVGRAGRQGQPGLVFAFAGAFNQHDRYFFRRPWEMVAGAVRAPTLELVNESLLKSHIFAEWLSDLGLPLHTSIRDVIDVGDPSLPLHQSVREQIQLWERNPNSKASLVKRIQRILKNDWPMLSKERWFSRDWIERVVNSSPNAFDRAFDDWRVLYKEAKELAQKSAAMIVSPNPEERERAESLMSEAMRQVNLLLQQNVTREEGDFYPYRYLASQEFLPGYNLMALPVRAWVPRKEGEYVTRPRYLAISEFAPGTSFYHEGRRWTPHRLVLPPVSGGPVVPRFQCKNCGTINPSSAATCATCERVLEARNTAIWRSIELTAVSMRRSRRITVNDEERLRGRFDIATGLEPTPGTVHRAQSTTIKNVIKLEYLPAVRIHYFNPGPFFVDLETGEVLSKSERDNADQSRPVNDVSLHVSVTQNALRIPIASIFLKPPDRETSTSLGYALKRGMEALFQVEERELGLDLVGEGRNKAYLYVERAEGGLGVLRRLVEEPDTLSKVARAALEVLHFDPDTGEDLAADRCKAACYECLLSYTNQSAFNDLNRHAALEYLLELAKTTVAPVSDEADSSRLDVLLEQCGSELERRFLRALHARSLPLPDEAQYRIENAHTVADFLYRKGQLAVYIDGPHHGEERQQRIDKRQRSALLELGYIPVVFSTADIEALERGESPQPLATLMEALA